MSVELVPDDVRGKYEVREWKHACAVLKGDFPSEWGDVLGVLRAFKLTKEDVTSRGGGLSLVSRWFNSAFSDRGWEATP